MNEYRVTILSVSAWDGVHLFAVDEEALVASSGALAKPYGMGHKGTDSY